MPPPLNDWAPGPAPDAPRPRAPADTTAERLGRGDAQGPTGTETVLLVEDEVAVRRTARRMLERHGYTVLEAEDGAAALRVWSDHQEHVAVLLTDLHMPGMDGIALVHCLRAHRPLLPAVLMSGYVTEPAAAADGKAAPGLRIETLAKPFSPTELLEIVRAALGARGTPS